MRVSNGALELALELARDPVMPLKYCAAPQQHRPALTHRTRDRESPGAITTTVLRAAATQRCRNHASRTRCVRVSDQATDGRCLSR